MIQLRGVPPLTTVSNWADPSKYKFLETRFAVNGDYLKVSDLDSLLPTTPAFQDAVTRNSVNTAALDAVVPRALVAFPNPVRGHGPGPQLTNTNPPEPGKFYWPTSITGAKGAPVPDHYVYYFIDSSGQMLRADQEIQPGLGSYLVTGDVITVDGYVVFGPSMTESTVYFKWFLPQGFKLVPGTQRVMIKSPATCRSPTSECINVKDYYRVARSQGAPNLDSEKMTVTRNRAVKAGALLSTSNENLIVVVDFTLVGRITTV